MSLAMRSAAILGIVAMAVAISACSPTTSQRDSSVWNEPPSYSYVVESSCGERTFLGTFDIRVEDFQVTGAVGLDEAARSAIDSGGVGVVPSLGDLVAEYEAARPPGGPAEATVEFARLDRSLDGSYPSLIVIDPSRGTDDDESCYSITEFRVIGLD